MTKLLIFVNKFDEDDDLLGFFVGWAVELASQLDGLVVIAQHVGEYREVPKLKVILNDKKKTPNPVLRAIGFIKLLFRLKNDYDGVLVIMAPAWAILASLTTKILGKRLYLWYAVWRGSWKLWLAEKLCNKIFSSVREAFPLKSKKLILLGQGIDTDYFVADESVRETAKIMFLGRISPIKKIELFLQAIAKLEYYDTMIYHSILLEVVGGVANEGDEKYMLGLKKIAEELEISDKIVWAGRVPHSATKRYYQRADIFVNMTPTGSFDKTMLEAMSCGDVVLASNKALAGFLDETIKETLIFAEGNADDLAVRLIKILKLSVEEKDKYRRESRRVILENHSQKQWALKLIENL